MSDLLTDEHDDAPRARVATGQRARPRRPVPANAPGPRRAARAWIAGGYPLSLLLLFGALCAIWQLAASPRFRIANVEVQGTEVLDVAQVAAEAGARGRSIWVVEPAAVAERLRANPYVEQVEVVVLLPDRMTITVHERRPEVRWVAGGTRWLVDGEGRVLGPDTATQPLTSTLLIEDRSGVPIAPDARVDPAALVLARTLSLRLPAEVGYMPQTISYTGPGGLEITTPDGHTIAFGDAARLEEKILVLRTLQNEATPFSYLDLRPETPYYRAAGAAGTPTVRPAP